MKYIILENIQEARAQIHRIEQYLRPAVQPGFVYTEPVMISNSEHQDHEKYIVKILTESDYNCTELYDVGDLKEFDNTWFQTQSAEELEA